MRTKQDVSIVVNSILPNGGNGAVLRIYKNDEEVYTEDTANGDTFYNIFLKLRTFSDPIYFHKDDIIKIQTFTNMAQTNIGVQAFCQLFTDDIIS